MSPHSRSVRYLFVGAYALRQFSKFIPQLYSIHHVTHDTGYLQQSLLYQQDTLRISRVTGIRYAHKQSYEWQEKIVNLDLGRTRQPNSI
ncbi:hypothetical protein Zmor_014444 [Zophobas morio]|uniref:Uncharacterized protein n=1 Tax=Zophobas morio TaxID=2755281 RepID=A0AA38IHS5_9CUCU|nr:hypothetical protein Zmor_014444 [Zophobas morio]